MIVISEADARELLTMADAIQTMATAFRAIHAKHAVAFPLVREQISECNAVFGVKSGACIQDDTLGLKAGGYWASNSQKGLTNHQSSTVLFNPETGQPLAFVGANYLTALRTAAVAGLATDRLSRPESSVMGIIGAGTQAVFQIEAVLAVRPISKLIVASRTEESARRLSEQARLLGIQEVTIGSTVEAAEQADVLTTITPAREAVVELAAVRPGTHINAMGADTAGKQEIDSSLLRVARVFVDDWTQAAAVGECQHGVSHWKMTQGDLAGTLGGLAADAVPGRVTADDITIFDSTGMALQDLSVARVVVDRARQRGMGQEIVLESAS
ncbi:ornithine cyclodeaminase [Natronocella acetinitrilica]|uniref:Ornithine cyclodeaminase n=1 Tax=Natronocella acetinitrilica TaxID=414046 RepID=A0AAE3G7D3_9GAMM|nr:ornithine cyclodeaminase family protein [Natronocella acetinitrilica]MCP1676403.1 ornithine cyclodeaminase [Natronocella acetinitrilica]